MDDKHTQLFMSLVYSFQMQCMIQMGKIKNPMTQEIDRDLNAAQITIDMLDMLQNKTANNLSDHEKRFLEQVTAELKLNFVDEKAKDEKNAIPGTKDEEAKTEDTSAGNENPGESGSSNNNA
jgi:PIN domain nuclease of toxin-antitoxin system